MSECWVCDMFSHQIVFIILPLALLILSVLLSCIFDSFSHVLYPHDALFSFGLVCTHSAISAFFAILLSSTPIPQIIP